MHKMKSVLYNLLTYARLHKDITLRHLYPSRVIIRSGPIILNYMINNDDF